MKTSLPGLLLATAIAAGCGPSTRDHGGGGGGDDTADDDPLAPDAGGGCVPTPEQCMGGVDEDCDGYIDCGDADCIGEAACPVEGCGELEELTGSLALPDGEGVAYTSSIDFTGFSPGQVLEDVNALLGVCVNMEHSWLRDLQIEISCPTGETVVLQMFLGQTGSEVFMGQPDDSDGVNPTPGVGADYCWTPTATNPPMLDYVNQTGVHDLPPGDYQAVTPMANLVGCTLNGPWTLSVEDLWGIDNGFIFSWRVRFDPGIVEDCEGWDPD